MEFEFSLPEKVVFGAGKLAQVGELAKKFGEKAMIACDPFFTQNGLAGKVKGFLVESGIETVVFDEIIPNPTTVLIDKGAEIAKSFGCQVIIGLGGGSSMDTAKAIAVAATHDGGIWSYAMGEKEITDKTLPVIAITTTSGTGSQCTCFSVITNPETNQKPGMGSPYILPKIALVDPELMTSVPKGMTIMTGFDVFAHAVEALTSNAATPVTDMFAEKAIELLAKNFPVCCEDPGNLDARAGMALADTYAGIAICHAVVTLGHVMAHVIGGNYHDIAHGDALFTIYRGIMKFNSTALPEKNKFIANQLDPGNDDVVSAFDNFFAQFSFENKLKAKNPDAGMIDKIAKETFTYMKAITELNPVEATVEDAKKILIDSLV